MAVTTTLYNLIESELVKKGFNEIIDKYGKVVMYNSDYSFTKKILHYDEEVSEIVDRLFFVGVKLKNEVNDNHFKKAFIHHFLNREINRQTVEAFSTQVVYTFMTNEDYLNRLYTDLDKYLSNTQNNTQENDSSNTTDNRSAFAELPQNNVQIDVNNTVMSSATDNTISRNKQVNQGKSNGVTEQYRLDELLKINGLLEQVYIKFDSACFLQVW